MPDLHTLLVASLTARLERARWATPGPWDFHVVQPHMDGSVQVRVAPPGKPKVFADVLRGVDFEYLRHHADPATEIRRVEAALRVVERHAPATVHYKPGCCAWCCDHDGQGLMPWPCDDIRDLAAGEGIEP